MDDKVLYVGKTTNQRTGLYTNHLQGNQSTARRKKYLVKDTSLTCVKTCTEAKKWIKEYCHFQFCKVKISICAVYLKGYFHTSLIVFIFS